ncbi:MAG: hypothetical protein IJV58_01590 [Oscillospiraceae bacterium]|nr:hypothetical protein [Oscillospiraceae bacterium]
MDRQQRMQMQQRRQAPRPAAAGAVESGDVIKRAEQDMIRSKPLDPQQRSVKYDPADCQHRREP